jgi:hypothetical protein
LQKTIIEKRGEQCLLINIVNKKNVVAFFRMKNETTNFFYLSILNKKLCRQNNHEMQFSMAKERNKLKTLEGKIYSRD